MTAIETDQPLSIGPSVVAPETASCVGVCLEAAESQVAGWFAADGPNVVSLMPPEAHAIPPAVLVPRFAGEPVRADVHWPPHPRGTGEPWPPEARVPDHAEPGRLPLGYAWRMLAGGTTWSWQSSQAHMSAKPAEAVAHAVAAVIRRHAGDESTGPHALIVPHHLKCAAQQDLLDAARGLGVNVKLLWRPVAAANAWCSHYAEEFSADMGATGEAQTIGSVLSFHMGLDQWELAVVDIAQTSDGEVTRFIPTRRRPVGEALPSYGLELMHRLARRTLEMSHQQPSAARVWELVWCTSWMKIAMAMMGGGDFAEVEQMPSLSPHVLTREFIRQQCRQATQHIFGPTQGVPGLLDKHLGPSPRFEEVRDWCDTYRRAIANEALLGAVVTGPMALVLDKQVTLGEHYLSKIWPNPNHVLMEGRDQPEGLLAHGAAAYARQLAVSAADGDAAIRRRTPLHRDTLPRIRMAAVRKGKPAWVDLLASDDRPTTAARRWRAGDNLPPVRIGQGTRSLELALWHEDHATVQRASVPLPHRLDRNETGRLRVSHEPAAGQPVIELRPDRDDLFEQAVIRFNLNQMTDTGLSPEAFLEKLGA